MPASPKILFRFRRRLANTCPNWILLAGLVLLSCGREPGRKSLYIFAAASLSDVLPAVIAAVADSLPQAEVRYNFAGSSVLARQILAGSPADVFISASPQWVQFLIKKKRIALEQASPLLSNRLALVVRADNESVPQRLEDLRRPDIRFIALGDPAHVPAGIYARQALQKAGLWDALRDRIVSGQDVRAALWFVEAGEADAAIVYATDARVSSRIRLAFLFPDSLQPEIVYTLAVLREDPAVRRLGELLRSSKAEEIYRTFGFIMTHSAP
ncbi:MAG: molybdate ABC transporter substrate-binding protein [candidate division KSB1 bacterium]|nr:molybdate ABC transporter substrate-binding protein [candidate division KSB1 bacterium]